LHQIPSFNEYENLSLLIIVNCAWKAGTGNPAQFLKITGNFSGKHLKNRKKPENQAKMYKKTRNL